MSYYKYYEDNMELNEERRIDHGINLEKPVWGEKVLAGSRKISSCDKRKEG